MAQAWTNMTNKANDGPRSEIMVWTLGNLSGD
jgi:hypothetical protein